MVQVRVLGIALDAAKQHIVLLKPLFDDGDDPRVLPIWIGTQEATSILIAISGEHAPRPLSHDLMMTMLGLLEAEIERVEVTRIETGTFYAEVTLVTPTGTRVVDARPSDAIALAVRSDVSIFVDDAVLEEAGIPAELAEVRAEEDTEEAKVDEFKRFLDDVDPEDFQG